MPHYRAYIIDEHGQFVSAIDFDCADDEEAKEHARGLDGRKVELWRELSLKPRESGNLDTLSISDDTAHGQPRSGRRSTANKFQRTGSQHRPSSHTCFTSTSNIQARRFHR
jgi:hypothetical protein